ncbi:MAG: YoaK family protein [Peptoniphilus sp.]|uniref:YoaK family protein n=1 Tax=Peptoniphilus sp. TaxID=1971214 RepID=UPI002A759EB6|nr:YoaK family protein [Peptoniphilus sp.]MDY2986484.1 YoaK family protein [Peptoniphilus sp.]
MNKKSKAIKAHEIANYRFVTWIYWMTMLTGAINVYAIKELGTPITHHTGNSSEIAISLYENLDIPYRLFILLGSFFIGSALSGILYYDKVRIPKKRYGISLIVGGSALIFTDFLNFESSMLFLISLLIGMQNGMFIKYKGTLIRTSHVTGYLTDAGFALGSYIRGRETEFWKVKFYILSIVFFIVGGFVGYIILENFNKPLGAIGVLYLLCGGYYFYLREYNQVHLIRKRQKV